MIEALIKFLRSLQRPGPSGLKPLDPHEYPTQGGAYIVIRRSDGSLVDDAIVFHMADDLFASTLVHYKWACITAGCDEAYLQKVELIMERVLAWRTKHPGRGHVPGTPPPPVPPVAPPASTLEVTRG